jgi:hypothetical protein
MLALKLGLSLVSTRPSGAWSPSDEAGLEAWYQNKVGITLNGTDVSAWEDSSTNGVDMVQDTATEQPAYNASTGALTFVDGDVNNLQSTGQVSLTSDFTIGIKLNLASVGGVVIADNTTSGEFMGRFTSATQLRIRIDNTSAINITKDSGSFAGDAYMVLTRVSGLISLWWSGTLQASTATLTGTADIDAIGVRATNVNPFDGDISEIQIYSSSSATLTANVNDRLSSL